MQQKRVFVCAAYATLVLGFGLSQGVPALAQTANAPMVAQQQPAQPDTQPAAAEAKTFAGKIVLSGDKLVLTDSDGKAYQLDDQQKAKEFVNKSVKVTGVLDAATGTIRVTMIEAI